VIQYKVKLQESRKKVEQLQRNLKEKMIDFELLKEGLATQDSALKKRITDLKEQWRDSEKERLRLQGKQLYHTQLTRLRDSYTTLKAEKTSLEEQGQKKDDRIRNLEESLNEISSSRFAAEQSTQSSREVPRSEYDALKATLQQEKLKACQEISQKSQKELAEIEAEFRKIKKKNRELQ
ncbi:hypothetical protein BT96DRAFT_952300, partial [Gymnopus androsaceus JB14]